MMGVTVQAYYYNASQGHLGKERSLSHNPLFFPRVSLGRVTEAEEAALAFAACGVTGYALADLAYGKGQGGQMLAGLLGRTVASPDVINIGISPRGFCRQRT